MQLPVTALETATARSDGHGGGEPGTTNTGRAGAQVVELPLQILLVFIVNEALKRIMGT